MAGVLTQNLVLQKSKTDDIRRVQKLNVCAAQLTDIGVLRHAASLEVLSLSLNEISELGAISNCSRLNELYLRKNQVRDINQVLHLTRLPYLEVVNLSDNPISRDPNYRRFVIAAIPSLERLDDINISDEERRAAVGIFPELTHFAPPASPYAQLADGYAPPPAAQSQQRSKPAAASRQRPQSSQAQPNPQQQRRAPATSHASNGDSAQKWSEGSRGGSASAPRNPSVNYLGSSSGPSEPGVVQAVKVLCSELSPKGLAEVRKFIDSMGSY